MKHPKNGMTINENTNLFVAVAGAGGRRPDL